MQFTYKAKQGPQKIVDGIIDAETVEGAVAKILEKGLAPLDVKQQTQGLEKKSKPAARPGSFLSRKIPAAEVVLFTRQVSDLLGSGVPLLQALVIVQRQIRSPVFKEHVLQMIAIVRDGGGFSAALSRFPSIFPLLYVNMVRAGEVAGNLDVVMDRLAEFTEKDQEVRSQVITSLMYPGLILFTGGVTIFVLLTWVIPKITLIFEDLNQALPLPTVILMALSGFFVRFWWAILGGVAVLLLYFKKFYETANGRFQIDSFKLKVPLIGTFFKDVQLERFARTLGTLLESGVDIIAALESVGLIMDNEVLKKEVRNVSTRVRDGKSLTAAIRGNDYFPDTVVSMVSVGEETGRTERGLYKLADYYERRAQRFTKRVGTLAEPILILGLGVVVGFVVMAMLMPIFRMNMVIQ